MTVVSPKTRASSVQQGKMKLYSPMNAINTEDTSSCWYSNGTTADNANDEDNQQSITINFNRTVLPQQLKIQFQAGFASESIQLHLYNNSTKNKDDGRSGTWDEIEDEIEVEDNHDIQTFSIPCKVPGDALRITFVEPADFYGRILIYHLGIWGTEVATASTTNNK